MNAPELQELLYSEAIRGYQGAGKYLPRHY